MDLFFRINEIYYIFLLKYLIHPRLMQYQLHQNFRDVSKRTKIPMTTLGRLSILKFINEIESKGITEVLKEMENV